MHFSIEHVGASTFGHFKVSTGKIKTRLWEKKPSVKGDYVLLSPIEDFLLVFSLQDRNLVEIITVLNWNCF